MLIMEQDPIVTEDIATEDIDMSLRERKLNVILTI